MSPKSLLPTPSSHTHTHTTPTHTDRQTDRQTHTHGQSVMGSLPAPHSTTHTHTHGTCTHTQSIHVHIHTHGQSVTGLLPTQDLSTPRRSARADTRHQGAPRSSQGRAQAGLGHFSALPVRQCQNPLIFLACLFPLIMSW